MMANFGEIATVGAAARADCDFGTLGSPSLELSGLSDVGLRYSIGMWVVAEGFGWGEVIFIVQICGLTVVIRKACHSPNRRTRMQSSMSEMFWYSRA